MTNVCTPNELRYSKRQQSGGPECEVRATPRIRTSSSATLRDDQTGRADRRHRSATLRLRPVSAPAAVLGCIRPGTSQMNGGGSWPRRDAVSGARPGPKTCPATSRPTGRATPSLRNKHPDSARARSGSSAPASQPRGTGRRCGRHRPSRQRRVAGTRGPPGNTAATVAACLTSFGCRRSKHRSSNHALPRVVRSALTTATRARPVD